MSVLNLSPKAATPKVSVGPGSLLGFALAILGGIGTVIAAIKHNDFATAASAAESTIAAAATVNSRSRQAVALIEKDAAKYAPLIGQVASDVEAVAGSVPAH